MPNGKAPKKSLPAHDTTKPAPTPTGQAVALPTASKAFFYSVPVRIDPPSGTTFKGTVTFSLQDDSSLPEGLKLETDNDGNPIIDGTPIQLVSTPLSFTVVVSEDGVAKLEALYSIKVDDPPTSSASPVTNATLPSAFKVTNPIIVGQGYSEALAVDSSHGCNAFSVSPAGNPTKWGLTFDQKKAILSSPAKVTNSGAASLPSTLDLLVTCDQKSGAGPAKAYFSIPVQDSRAVIAAIGAIPGQLGKPTIIAPVNAGSPTISISAAANKYLTFYSLPQPQDPSISPSCQRDISTGTLLELKSSATNVTPITTFKTTEDQIQVVYPQQALVAGTVICVVEADVAATPNPSSAGLSLSTAVTVDDTLDWGRVRAYFVGGVLISNNQGNFSSSSANQFLDLNVDKFWHVPYCAIYLNSDGGCQLPPQTSSLTNFRRRLGFSTYFDTRLTAIPISATTTTTTTSTTPATPAMSAVTSTNSTALTSQKTARVQVGMYFPYLVTTWNHNRTGNALYVGPIGKLGFDTLTGSTTPATATLASTNSASTGGSTTNTVQQSQQLDRVYNFYTFGARIGHFGLYPTRNKAPELLSYLDVNYGPYSSLESYICEQSRPWAPVNISGSNTTTVSSCGAAPLTNLPYASLKRIWRLDLEGLLQIPATPIVIGFNANIGQLAVGAKNIDNKRIPADDVRFLFGTKFDIATVMKKLGVNQ